MYQGQIKAADFAEAGDSKVLRQLRWTDLVARLAATRDFRDSLEQAEASDGGTFASFRSDIGEQENQGEGVVNHDALSRGKHAELSPSAPHVDAERGDRER